jgi:hypothetical protein
MADLYGVAGRSSKAQTWTIWVRIFSEGTFGRARGDGGRERSGCGQERGGRQLWPLRGLDRIADTNSDTTRDTIRALRAAGQGVLTRLTPIRPADTGTI